jgi:hypothetical protein
MVYSNVACVIRRKSLDYNFWLIYDAYFKLCAQKMQIFV